MLGFQKGSIKREYLNGKRRKPMGNGIPVADEGIVASGII